MDGSEPKELRAQGASLSERHDGCGMGAGRAAGGRPAARSGAAAPGRSSRGSERGLLHFGDGLPVAGAAAGPAAAL